MSPAPDNPGQVVPAHPETRRRLSVILVLGFVLALTAGIAFAALAEDVLERQGLALDQTFGGWLLGLATPTRSVLFFWITQLARAELVAIATLAIAVALYSRQRRPDALFLIVAVAGGATLNVLLKQFFERPRPGFPGTYYQEIGFSFPSGHAMLSVVFYGALAYLIGKSLSDRRWRFALACAAVILALVIGFSRIFLGVHYLSDVLGGWAAGTCWLLTCIGADELIRASRFRHARVPDA